MTNQEFMRQARPLHVQLGDLLFAAYPKQFSKGSVGWYLSHKGQLLVAQQIIPIQVSLCLTAIGSRNGTCGLQDPTLAQEPLTEETHLGDVWEALEAAGGKPEPSEPCHVSDPVNRVLNGKRVKRST